MSILGVILSVFISLLMHLLSCGPFDDFMAKVNKDIMLLRDVIESSYADRCMISDFNNANCSYYSCSDSYPLLSCNPSFVYPTQCACYNAKAGLNMNMGKSGIRLANAYAPFTDSNDISVKEIISSTAVLDYYFKILTRANPTYKWVYFGSLNGVMRQYPLTIKCSPYDNRLRPWYVGASSGTKNLILILDFSGSMNGDRLDKLKKAISILIDSLTSSDRIGLITFNSTALLFSPRLERATNAYKSSIIQFIKNKTATGGTNFQDAFIKADQLVGNTKTNPESDTSCKNIIIFVTDGKPSDGIVNLDELLSFIDKLPNLKDITIFSYAVGSIIDTKYPEQISCLRNGIFEYIEDIDMLSMRLNSYFIALTYNLEINKPMWIEPYQDASGLGKLTSCAAPVYDRSGKVPFLIGVVAIDILIDDLLKIESSDAILKKIYESNKSQCIKLSFTKCQINSLRNQYFQCSYSDNFINVADCSITSAPKTCPNKSNFAVFCEGSDLQTKTSQPICCGSSNQTCLNFSKRLELLYITLIGLFLLFL